MINLLPSTAETETYLVSVQVRRQWDHRASDRVCRLTPAGCDARCHSAGHDNMWATNKHGHTQQHSTAQHSTAQHSAVLSNSTCTSHYHNSHSAHRHTQQHSTAQCCLTLLARHIVTTVTVHIDTLSSTAQHSAVLSNSTCTSHCHNSNSATLIHQIHNGISWYPS